MSNDVGEQPARRSSLSLKMRRNLKKMKRSILKIADNVQDDDKRPSYMLPERLSSLASQTGFSKEEIRKLYRVFKQHCPRGAATTNDLKPAYAKLFPLGDPTKYSQIVFNSFDRDGDGVVTFGDLIAETASIVKGNTDDKLSWIFRLYDLNGDGCITRREMLAFVSAIYEMMLHNGQTIQRIINKHVDRFFEKMDVDKDGVVSREEFMRSCKNDSIIYNQLEMFNNIW